MWQCRFVCGVVIFGFTTSAFAQQLGQSGPGALKQTSVTIEGKTIAVKYVAPSMKGRKIFGALVPYKQVWRIGNDAVPTFHTDADLVFQGVIVPKGDYSLYVLVDPNGWQLIINKQTGTRALTYNPKMDLGRVPMKMSKPPAALETCSITISKTAAMAAKLEVAWENTSGSAIFHLDRVAEHPEW